MASPTKGARLGGGPAHERLMLNNMASSLFKHRRITTTETKAKRLRPIAERLVTFAKRGDLHARRKVMTQIHDKTVVHELFTEIAPLMEGRDGGYTRITKLGFRKGDNAPMAVIELVLEKVEPKPKSNKKKIENTVKATEAEVTEEPEVTEEAEVVEAVEETQAEAVTEEQAPAEEAAAEAPAEEPVAEEAPVEEAAAEEAPAEEAVAEEAAAEETEADAGDK
ncbi:MAG TPA: 50S ribosomal protein L17, partial [Microbacteriaceae bacterium]